MNRSRNIASDSHVKQHYVAKSYLKHFSSDGKSIWKFDGNSSCKVNYKKECQEDYFYSRDDRESIENSFGKTEDAYGNFHKALKKGHISKDDEFSQALFIPAMIRFHFRTSKYINGTSISRFDSGERITHAYTCQRVLSLKDGDKVSEKELLYLLSCKWRVDLLKIPHSASETLITSDCPTILLHYRDFRPLIIMPISPSSVAVARNKYDFLVDGDYLTDKDLFLLNYIMSLNSDKAIFSKQKLLRESESLFASAMGVGLFEKRKVITLNHDNAISFKDFSIRVDDEGFRDLSFIDLNNTGANETDIVSYGKALELRSKIHVDHQEKMITQNDNMSLSELYCTVRADEIEMKWGEWEKHKQKSHKGKGFSPT